MNPDQNPYPIDYLNQIAPVQPKPGLGDKKFIFMVGGGLLLALIVGGFLLFGGGGANSPKNKMQTLAARMTTLQTVANNSQKTIKSSALRSTNSTLTIFLANANRDVAQPFKNNGVDVAKIDKNITATENGDALTKTLEDARLNAVFDRTYAREMNYQLETVAALMKDIYMNSNSKSLKDFLTATDTNLQPIKKQFAEFNAANG